MFPRTWPLSHALFFILSTYVAVDVMVKYRGDTNLPHISFRHWRGQETEEWPGQAEICSTREGYIEIGDVAGLRYKPRTEGENPWNQMKWVGEVAPCRVKGHLIDKLDDERNFRRGFALRFTGDVEDRTHLLPWILASKIDLNQRVRRVFLDLGASYFNTSLTWFMRMYPCDFTEIHAFEFNAHLLQKPSRGFDEEANIMDPNAWSYMTKVTPEATQWMLDRIKVYHKLVGDEDDTASNSINITRFIKEELQLKATDTVVVKMDIEGGEWPILRRWINDPEMPKIIDELFVEVHYHHPSLANYASYGCENHGEITKQNAKEMVGNLRWHGFFAHFWP